MGNTVLGRRLALFGPVGQRALAHGITHWNVPGQYGLHGELFFLFLMKKEQVVASTEVLPNPFVSAETLKACALNGLHLLAAGGEAGSSPESGDMWKHGCPKNPDWDGDVESWTESEGTSSSVQCEHNVESLALNSMGQDQSGEKISLFLEDIGNLRGWL